MRRRVQRHISKDHILTVWSGYSSPFQVSILKNKLALRISSISDIGCETWEDVFSLINNIQSITYTSTQDHEYMVIFEHPSQLISIPTTEDFLTIAISALNAINKEYYEKSTRQICV